MWGDWNGSGLMILMVAAMSSIVSAAAPEPIRVGEWEIEGAATFAVAAAPMGLDSLSIATRFGCTMLKKCPAPLGNTGVAV